MTQTGLPERPKPPTGREMLADIAGADDDDIIFVSGQHVELADLTPDSPESAPEGAENPSSQAALQEAEKTQRMYQKAVELLERVQTLQEAPGKLQVQFSQLEGLGKEMAKAINDLKDSSSNLMTKKTKKKHNLMYSKGKKENK